MARLVHTQKIFTILQVHEIMEWLLGLKSKVKNLAYTNGGEGSIIGTMILENFYFY